ncbi:hypothetical protein [Aerococcus urinaeequi]|uniref:hypothetical protein n=1 Tax=Aerococcus urinaeequi TaxID=51665 RepID=UPI003D6BC113
MGTTIPILIIVVMYCFYIFSVLVNLTVTKFQLRSINFVWILAILILAYNFVPTEDLDLYRYYDYLNITRGLSWENISDTVGFYTTGWITNLYFFIMRNVENRGLFSAIPTTIIFTVIFIVTDYFNNSFKSTSFRAVALFVLSIISVSSLLGIISGIRQNFAWMLIMIAIYYDYFYTDNKNLIKIILYILPVLVHVSSLPFIIIRLLISVIGKFKFLKNLVILWPILSYFLMNFANYFPPIIQTSLTKLEIYSSLNNYDTRTVTLNIILYSLIALFTIQVKTSLSNSKYKEYYYLYSTILLFGITSYFVPTLFNRTLELVMFISLPIFIVIFKELKWWNIITIPIFIATLGIMFIYQGLFYFF